MTIDSSAVARHYDELDELYRSIWGDRLHHGIFTSGVKRTVEEATLALLDLVTAPLKIRKSSRVLDIGCGYGTDAHWLAEIHGAHVTGVTLSSKQAQWAQGHPDPPQGSVTIVPGDVLGLDESPFDAILSLETVDHIENKRAFFTQLFYHLKPGGRAAFTCWTAPEDPSAVETLLLRALCHEGRLPSLPTLRASQDALAHGGLQLLDHQDLTAQVSPTWPRIAQQTLALLIRRPAMLGSLLATWLSRPSLALPIPLMILAYHTGTLRYHFFYCERSKLEASRR